VVGHWHKSEDRQGTLHRHVTLNLLPGSTIWLTMRCFVFVFFLFFCFAHLFVFPFFSFFLFGCGSGYLCCVYVFILFCVYVVYSWLSFGRLTFIYEKYKLFIIHYFLYYLFLQTKCVGNLSMVFSIQKAIFFFIWSKWRLMGIIFRQSNII
jgi:hypothetical protein